MNEDQRLMYYVATCIANANIAGMQAENDFSKARGDYPVYRESHFQEQAAELMRIHGKLCEKVFG